MDHREILTNNMVKNVIMIKNVKKKKKVRRWGLVFWISAALTSTSEDHHVVTKR